MLLGKIIGTTKFYMQALIFSLIAQTEDGRLKIVHSDLFSIDPEACGKFDGVWDRGSLVAIYHEDRER